MNQYNVGRLTAEIRQRIITEYLSRWVSELESGKDMKEVGRDIKLFTDRLAKFANTEDMTFDQAMAYVEPAKTTTPEEQKKENEFKKLMEKAKGEGLAYAELRKLIGIAQEKEEERKEFDKIKRNITLKLGTESCKARMKDDLKGAMTKERHLYVWTKWDTDEEGEQHFRLMGEILKQLKTGTIDDKVLEEMFRIYRRWPGYLTKRLKGVEVWLKE